ncbi:LysR family transcriptional regulator [Isoptericola halotolerans]|uniref:DNA-binding transcriptional LysR family regulator n=1 Tax=Isoptericola halotolerans TaxID=300560 RepID=A0ABX2A4F9_9MICO|nr:LysR family transcriptional regulator [Isoptericola halotolerans]NOV97466.1 DNA-binding transcriptional LysR family regulator [Isoptericola halotolerans]
MDPRHLELLRELADRGSVSAVAAATHRTPSAVSQQLRTAQRDLGAPLVEPHGRGVRLTDAGRLLADGAVEVATALAGVQARWDAFQDAPAGTVTVAALPSAATFLLPTVDVALAGSGIRLTCTDVDLAEAAYGALTADHDIVIAHSLTSVRPAGTHGLTVVPVVGEPLDVAMSTHHPLAAQETVDAHDVVGAAWIGVPAGYPFDTVLQSIEQATGAQLDVRQRLRDNRLIEALVAAGDRLAVLPRFTTPTDDRLTLRPLTGVPATRHVSAVMRPDRARRRAVRQVLDAVVRAAQETARRHHALA